MTGDTRPGLKRFWRWVGAGVALGLAIAVLWGLVQHDRQRAWSAPRDAHKLLFSLWVFWGCWLLWPAAIALLWALRRSWRQAGRRWLVLPGLALLMACSALIWGRFIEPRLLVVRETNLSTVCGVRVALVSDLHLGIFSSADQLGRLVDRLNGLDVDAVLVAGDWTGEPPRDLPQLLAPLKSLRHPMYSVAGNHDEESPGAPLTYALHQALASVGVLNAEARRLPLGHCELIGLGDLSSGSTAKHLASLAARPSAVPATHRVMLAHEPGSAQALPADQAFLSLVGHTHGGQVKPPRWARDALIRLTHGRYQEGHGGFVQGVYELPHTRMFVTSGIGMSDLPFRYDVPPAIDVLNL